MTKSKIILLGFIVLVVAAFLYFDLGQYVSFDKLKQNQQQLQAMVEDNFWAVSLGFFAVYVLTTALSLPGATILTIAAGAIFGLLIGVLIVSFASSIGATLAFLASRFLFQETVKNKFGDRISVVNQGIAEDGAFYLFSLRLIPLIPFFVVNLLFGLSQMKARTFYWVSQIGMLAGTIVYVNAGTQLSTIESPSDILSAKIIGSFVLLGLFPLIAKKILSWAKGKKDA